MNSPDPAAKQRGIFLRRLREDARLEQTEVGAAVGVARVTVSRWETGRAAPPRSALREMVMLYMARGAKVDVAAAAEVGVEVPLRTSERPPDWGPYGKLAPIPDEVREPAASSAALEAAVQGARDAVATLGELRGYAIAVVHMVESVLERQKALVDGLTPYVQREAQVGNKAMLTDAEVRAQVDALVEQDAATPTGESAPASARPRRSGGR